MLGHAPPPLTARGLDIHGGHPASLLSANSGDQVRAAQAKQPNPWHGFKASAGRRLANDRRLKDVIIADGRDDRRGTR
jgi:hypothetical protein